MPPSTEGLNVDQVPSSMVVQAGSESESGAACSFQASFSVSHTVSQSVSQAGSQSARQADSQSVSQPVCVCVLKESLYGVHMSCSLQPLRVGTWRLIRIYIYIYVHMHLTGFRKLLMFRLLSLHRESHSQVLIVSNSVSLD